MPDVACEVGSADLPTINVDGEWVVAPPFDMLLSKGWRRTPVSGPPIEIVLTILEAPVGEVLATLTVSDGEVSVALGPANSPDVFMRVFFEDLLAVRAGLLTNLDLFAREGSMIEGEDGALFYFAGLIDGDYWKTSWPVTTELLDGARRVAHEIQAR